MRAYRGLKRAVGVQHCRTGECKSPSKHWDFYLQGDAWLYRNGLLGKILLCLSPIWRMGIHYAKTSAYSSSKKKETDTICMCSFSIIGPRTAVSLSEHLPELHCTNTQVLHFGRHVRMRCGLSPYQALSAFCRCPFMLRLRCRNCSTGST